MIAGSTNVFGNMVAGHTLSKPIGEHLHNQFAQPEVVSTSLAYYRQNATPPILLGLRSTPTIELTRVTVPILIINGRDDGCINHLEQPGIVTELALSQLAS